MKRKATQPLQVSKLPKAPKAPKIEPGLSSLTTGPELISFLEQEAKPYASLVQLLALGHAEEVPRILGVIREHLGAELFLSQFLGRLEMAQETHESLTCLILCHPIPAFYQLFLDHPELNFTNPPHSNLIYQATRLKGPHFHLGLTALRAALETYPPELATKLNTWVGEGEGEGEDCPCTHLAELLRRKADSPLLEYDEYVFSTVCRLAPHLLPESRTPTDDLFTLALREDLYGLLPLFLGNQALEPDYEQCFLACRDIYNLRALSFIFAMPGIGTRLYEQFEGVDDGDDLSPKLIELDDEIFDTGTFGEWQASVWNGGVVEAVRNMARILGRDHPTIPWQEEDDEYLELLEAFDDCLDCWNTACTYPGLGSLEVAQSCLLRCHASGSRHLVAPFWCSELPAVILATTEPLLEAARALEPEHSRTLVWLEAPQKRFVLVEGAPSLVEFFS